MPKWVLESIEVNGGFLPGLSLSLPRGFTCIIGPRGSGKSTLIEAIRFGISGLSGASKARTELVQNNLAGAVLTMHTLGEDETAPRYVVRRTLKQAPTLTTADGRILSADLDRGTFLPLDAYSSTEIESIADESVGDKRRSLLDELIGEQLRDIHLAISDHHRALSANADRIRAVRRLIEDTTEQIEEISDVRAQLAALPETTSAGINADLATAARQQQANKDEAASLQTIISGVVDFSMNLSSLHDKANRELLVSLAVEGTSNATIIRKAEQAIKEALTCSDRQMQNTLDILAQLQEQIIQVKHELDGAHMEQQVEFSRLQNLNIAESRVINERTALEQQVAKLNSLEARRESSRGELTQLLDDRKELKSRYLTEHERISQLRESVAVRLQQEIGGKVRIRVLRDADDLAYTQALIEGLRGAGVRNHDDILKGLRRLRPEQLAQIVQNNDIDEFDQQMSLGPDRARKVLDAFREKVDPLDLEVVPIEDRICIELNVGTTTEPNYKDAANLSRGQKCTALLPLLIARRDTPLVIDQPEDNLDNHFIYETVVDTIVKAKQQRQMIFVTHNANIPVLAEADLIVVLDSDGKIGFIGKQGGLDDCRDEIIDLLEGGRKAFELRRERYNSV